MDAICGRLLGSHCRGAIAGVVVAVLTLEGALTGLAWAQARVLLKPGPLEYISRGERGVIRSQVELGIKFAEMARGIVLQHGGQPEELTRANAFAEKSYVFLRYAMHGVGFIIDNDGVMTYEKTLARMALAAINQARERNLTAQRAIGNSIPWPETREQYVAQAVRELEEAIATARRASVLLR